MKTILSLAFCLVVLVGTEVRADPPAPRQPAPGVAVQPNPPYQSYSYHPQANYQPAYRQPSREPMFFSGLQRASYKVRGEYWAK